MTHFLDIKGKIADGEAILKEYYAQLLEAQKRNDSSKINQLKRLIETQENYLSGLRHRAQDSDV